MYGVGRIGFGALAAPRGASGRCGQRAIVGGGIFPGIAVRSSQLWTVGLTAGRRHTPSFGPGRQNCRPNERLAVVLLTDPQTAVVLDTALQLAHMYMHMYMCMYM